MWRPILRKVILPSIQDVPIKFTYSTKSRLPRSTVKISLISASVGVLIGAGYGGYTHYKVNIKKHNQAEPEDFAFLKEAPDYKPQYQVNYNTDNSNLHLVLFQYRTCPFCCKVRAYLDTRGISYEIVEVDAVLRQAIKWSGYKKVPILLAKVEGGYQQLLDSTAIISILETYLADKSTNLRDIIKFYPATRYINETGKSATEIANKYFVMHNAVISEKEKNLEIEERKWRQWADEVLVHTLSPNVYRTIGESYETFKWFEKAGGWRESFPTWECALMVYVGAAAMWMISKRLKARHNIQDDVRQSLYNAANEWLSAVKKKGTQFHGGDQPNLADITVFGVLSSIEGCQAFNDLCQKTEIAKWFSDMKSVIENRHGRVMTVQI